MTDLLHPPGLGRPGRPRRQPAATPRRRGGRGGRRRRPQRSAGVRWARAASAGSPPTRVRHGTTRDALRVATDGWLLGHGAHLHLVDGRDSATISVVPLGLMLLFGYLAHRFGRWAAGTSAVEDDARCARCAGARGRLRGGGAGLRRARGDRARRAQPAGVVRRRLPGGAAGRRDRPGARRGRRPGWASVPAACGRSRRRPLGHPAAWPPPCLLLTVALLVDLGSAANVLSRLHTDVSGGLLYTVLVAAVAPNAVLLTGAYLLGPGFAVGTGTLVSPAAVTLAPVPAFPLLAALPAGGTPPAWLSALVAAPVVAAALGAVADAAAAPGAHLRGGAVRGLGAGPAPVCSVPAARGPGRRLGRPRPDGRRRRRRCRPWSPPRSRWGSAGWPAASRRPGGPAGAEPSGRSVASAVPSPCRPSARLVVLVSGAGTNLQALLDACADQAYGAEVVAVGADRRRHRGARPGRAGGRADVRGPGR